MEWMTIEVWELLFRRELGESYTAGSSLLSVERYSVAVVLQVITLNSILAL